MIDDERQRERWTVDNATPGNSTGDQAAADGNDAPAVDELTAWLQAQVSAEARRARTMHHVEQVAQHVELLRRHRPLEVEILTSAMPGGGGEAQEVGFHTTDGAYVGLEAPRVLCSAHDQAEAWPCAEIRALAAQYRVARDGVGPA